MAFERIKQALKPKKRDPFDAKGLEGFSKAEQERILGRISSRESEILKRKADTLADRRIEQLERQLGIHKERGQTKSIGEKLQGIKEFRQRNLVRRAARQKQFAENERLFREGKLAVKPVGNPEMAKDRKLVMKKQETGKLNVKPVSLKAPGSKL